MGRHRRQGDASLGWVRGKSPFLSDVIDQRINAWNARVEAKEAPRIPVNSVDHVFGRVPDELPPVIRHGSRGRGVVYTEVIFAKVFILELFDRILIISMAKYKTIGRRKADQPIARIDHHRAAQGAAVRLPCVFTQCGVQPQILHPLLLAKVIAYEVARVLSYAVKEAACGIYRHGDDTLAVRGDRQVFKFAGGQVVG